MAKANKPTATPARSAPKTTSKTSAAPVAQAAAKAPTKASAKAGKASAPTAAKAQAPSGPAPSKAPAKAAKAPAKAAKAPAKSVKAPAAAVATPANSAKKAARPVPASAKPAEQSAAKPKGSNASGASSSTRPATTSAKPPSATKGTSSAVAALARPAVKGVTKEGIAYTKDFDAKFLTRMRAQLLEERDELTGQATRLEDEANALVAEAEMGDVQFDDEGGEGDTMVVERERDLALSAQARQLIADIDAALSRMGEGSYGYSVLSGRPIPRERLEAIPWADVLVEEKAGGLGRR